MRKIVYKILVRLEKSGYRFDAEEELHKICSSSNVSNLDHRFAHEIFLGCLRNKMLLEFYLSKLSNRKIEKIDVELKWIILIALYQLVFLNKVAEYAAVNEAVSLCKNIRKKSWGGFVNGVLRNFIRENKNDGYEIKNPSIKFSNPEWLTNKWTEIFGEEKAFKILEWNNSVPSQFGLILKNSEFVLEEFSNNETAVLSPEFGENILKIKNISKFLSSESFKKGFLYLMDPWSAKVANQLPLEKDKNLKNLKFLDMCAAPGGKSIAIASRENINIIAADNSKPRINILNENLKRCKFNNIKTENIDSLKSSKIFGKESFDAVLLDAPCSSVGVIHRHPEIRYKIHPTSFEVQSKLQKALLKEAVTCVKPGGYILYSTCSFMPEENEEVVKTVLTDKIKCIKQERDLPGENKTDGGYFALLQNHLIK
ncbi:MAG: transcription antitermination factor NusB [Alphaproteobacteria bacterium]